MTTTTTTLPMRNADEPNGVPVEKLRGTIAKLTDNPDLAAFRFTAKNSWVEGTATKSIIHEWHGAGADHVHSEEFSATSDHPTLGHGHGATPHEFVLHALASCIAAGVATTAANRGINLTKIETIARGSMDVRGILGIDPDVRNGFSSIDVQVELEGDADQASLDALISSSTKRSAVFDVVTAPTPVIVTPKA